MTRSLSLAPVPDPSAEFGLLGALVIFGFGDGDPLSAQAQRPSRPSGGYKEQEPAKNKGGAGASFRFAVDRAEIAADRHRYCPCRAQKVVRFESSPSLANPDEYRVNLFGNTTI